MATRAGVWIDHKQATVVLITDAGSEIKKFKTLPQSAVQKAGAPRSKSNYTSNDFTAEDRRERKAANDRKKVFDDVLACLRGASSIFILGPGEAKGEFSKHIQVKKIRGLGVELETVDKLTDRQLVAKVSEHFSVGSVRSSTPPKKTASRKTAPAASGKRAKRSRK